MKNQEDPKKSLIKSILTTNLKEKGRDSKRISWGESKVVQYQKGMNTAIIEEINESMQSNYYPNSNSGHIENRKIDNNFNKVNNNPNNTYNSSNQDLIKYIPQEKQFFKEPNKIIPGEKERSERINPIFDLIGKKKETNPNMKIQQESDKKTLKPPRVTLNLNEILNKSDQSSSSSEIEQKKKKSNRLTINLKETLQCLNNDDSSDGSVDKNKYDPKNYFNTSSKRIQSSSKISLSPIMMDKDKLFYDVCNSSATRKLDYGDKLMNNIKTDDEEFKMNNPLEKEDIIEATKNNDKLLINNKDIEEIKVDMPKKNILYKDNFSEIMEVDEGNYSKASEDTPEFPNVTQSVNKESIDHNRETIDLNLAIQIQNNVLDIQNNSSLSNNLTPSLKNNQLFSTLKKKRINDNVPNKLNNFDLVPISQSLPRLSSPSNNIINMNSNLNYQIISPIREKKYLNLESIIKEKDVKVRIEELKRIIEDVRLQKEKILIENKEHINQLNDNSNEISNKKEKNLKEKTELIHKLEEIKPRINKLKDNLNITSSISQTSGLSILNTENNTMILKILNYITLNMVFKKFTRELCNDRNYTFQLHKVSFSFDNYILNGMNNDVKNEIFLFYDVFIHNLVNLNKNNNESSSVMNLSGLIEIIKKLVKFSSFIIYLCKCLSMACVATESTTFTLQNEKNILQKTGHLKLKCLNNQGILIVFLLEIDIFNCFVGNKLVDVSIDNISHQKLNDQELHKLKSLIDEVKDFLNNNNNKIIFRLKKFIQNIPNIMNK